ncbi:afadin isoform X6 [Chiloscyllium plagiosum]|uniref:afadin isoform X6 n=1 Tax=Chiloscyllium plagiosum TaxID=36176 RepID=UPI001CB7F3CC|nr:afadin isoform X6 [Chiloscyllium plagiosum]
MSSREEERTKLAEIINHWNANRLDLFEISQPTEDLEFHGVMRFYFQDKVAGNFATKCIRVSSTATTQDVIETLAEKFRPDMRMLSSPRYSLYEVHVSGEERRLDQDEKPLVVQLNWNKDDREGRFVLKNENAFLPPKKSQSNGPEKEKEGVIQNFKRTLSKKEKKEKKRREKEALMQTVDDDRPISSGDGENSSSHLAAEVYKDMPETSFTRTISNPEVVMKRRRQQKLEQRMQEFRSGDGRPDSGGTLRIYADSLKPNIPYKTILLSTTDTSDFAVGEALDKYGLEKENPKEYCIARVVLPPGVQQSDDKGAKETLLDDDECPLQIFRDWPSDKGTLVFQLKKRPSEHIPKNVRKQDGRLPKGKERNDNSGYGSSLPPEKLPYLVELSPDGSDSRDKPKLYRLQLNVTDVGTEKSDENSIQLFGPGIQPHHCDLTNMDGIVTVTPRSFDAETYVDGQHITETTMLQSGMNIQFGSSHVFKFVDPAQNHVSMRPMDAGPMVKGQRIKSGQGSRSVQETTFDLDGDIHSGMPLTMSKSSDRLDSEHTVSSSSSSERNVVKPIVRVEQQDYYKQEIRPQDVQGHELTLPATIEFRESSEDSFLSAVVNYTNSSTVHFKLSPTYVLYMTCRYVLSSQYRPDMSPSERTHKVIAIVNKMVSMMEGVIQDIAQYEQKQKNIAGALAFWMANASELLNFIKQDRDLSRITLDAQDVLAHLVQMAFKYLVHCLQSDLNNYIPAFLEDPEEASPQRPKIDDVLHTLTGAMSLLRRCRVNAALTIQLFSQLFHFINMWLFNKLVTEPDSCLCSHYWGAIIRQQLGHIEAWAEKQGLELAADCHLSRIVQATTLLTMDKYLAEDISNINNTCFKLNSLQLQALLQSYHCAQDEPYIPQELIENVVALAENTADELARSDGREVQLEEDPDLQLPFLLPEDGYSCDVVRNIPNGLQEFLEPLCQRGFCRLTSHSRSPGTWTVYFESADYESNFPLDTELAEPNRKEPEIITVTLKKQNGMGLSIVAAKGAGQDKLGIYVKSVVKGGAADLDGRLAAGDQLLSVDGRSLVGLSQERAAEFMTRTGSVVTLEIARQGAIYHGLATLLNQPSPMMQRASDRRGTGKPRPKSEGFELYNSNPQNGTPENSPMGWTEYSEPKKPPGDDRLLKNRADHRSSPNVANQPPSPGVKPVYSTAPTSKIQSVSTGNLCAEEQVLPTRPEAYPIPTQTYAREYFTFPTSRSQDRVSPVPGQWQHYDDRTMMQEQTFSGTIQRGTRSQEELHETKAFHPEKLRQEDMLRRDTEYQKDLDRKPDVWAHQITSMDSSASGQEQLNYSSKSLPPSAIAPHKSGPGRWKTPAPNQATPVAVSQPIRMENQLPPPPPPPPVHYAVDFDNSHSDLPLPPPPPPPPASQGSNPSSVVDRRKREDQQRWYEKEKARLEEERDRKRREQDRKIGQMRGPPPLHITPSQPVHVTPVIQQTRPEKMASLSRPQDTVIRELQPQQQPRTIERRDLQYITISKEQMPGSDSLSPDPWKRDAKEKMEKQQQQHLLEMLSKEIQELQNKPDRTSEENDRLRKLMLEWQFQKRLQESKEKDDDDEEEEDDDVDATLIMQRLEVERRARTVPAISVLDLLQDEERRRHQQLEDIRKREAEERARQDNERHRQEEEQARRETEEKRRQEEEYYTRLEAERRRQQEEAERKLLQPDEPGFGPYGGSTTSSIGANEVYKSPREKRPEQNKGNGQEPEAPAVKGSPENLTFKERQRLFSHGQDISNKVKASRKLMELENELNTK